MELQGLLWNMAGRSGGELVTRPLLCERIAFPLRSTVAQLADSASFIPPGKLAMFAILSAYRAI